jgi:hypothetical protein
MINLEQIDIADPNLFLPSNLRQRMCWLKRVINETQEELDTAQSYNRAKKIITNLAVKRDRFVSEYNDLLSMKKQIDSARESFISKCVDSLAIPNESDF